MAPKSLVSLILSDHITIQLFAPTFSCSLQQTISGLPPGLLKVPIKCSTLQYTYNTLLVTLLFCLQLQHDLLRIQHTFPNSLASKAYDISFTEGSGASENESAANLTNSATTNAPLVVDGSRPISTLPRSASMGNIGSLRSAAVSRASDCPGDVQSVTIEDPFLSPDKPLPISSATSVTSSQPDCLHAIQGVKTPAQDMSPRQDRLGQQVTPANAQGIHTPAACVFMAK